MIAAPVFAIIFIVLVASSWFGIILIPEDNLAWLNSFPVKIVLMFLTLGILLWAVAIMWQIWFLPSIKRVLLNAFRTFINVTVGLSFGALAFSEVTLIEKQVVLKFSDYNLALALTTAAFGFLGFFCLLVYWRVHHNEQIGIYTAGSA